MSPETKLTSRFCLRTKTYLYNDHHFFEITFVMAKMEADKANVLTCTQLRMASSLVFFFLERRAPEKKMISILNQMALTPTSIKPLFHLRCDRSDPFWRVTSPAWRNQPVHFSRSSFLAPMRNCIKSGKAAENA